MLYSRIIRPRTVNPFNSYLYIITGIILNSRIRLKSLRRSLVGDQSSNSDRSCGGSVRNIGGLSSTWKPTPAQVLKTMLA